MQKDISPEEKLLSLIKGQQARSGEKNAGKPEAEEGRAGAVSFKNKLDDYILIVLKNSFLKNSLFNPDILKAFNKYMVIILAVAALYFIFDILLVSPSRNAASIISSSSASGARMPLAEKRMPIETKNYSYYSSRMAGKGVFRGSSYAQTESQDGQEPGGELSGGNLGLVGIVPGDNPQAIIEEKKNQKTYYLIKGQSVNGITIENISEDKVTLEYRGKRLTLVL